PRIVGIRDGRVQFDLAPDKVTAELLEELYAGHADEEREVAALRAGMSPFGRACWPLPGFDR
ncbi:MAG: hypothetical protein ACREKB_09900, partial [Candidatus Rokuibacteriota bacterium]